MRRVLKEEAKCCDELKRKGKVRRVFLGGGGMHAETNVFGSESATMKCELLAPAIKRER